MRYSATYLPIANRDIIEIDNALAEYPAKARRLFQEIENKVKMLEDMPYIWPVIKPIRSIVEWF
jgi:plasmid stabilization system protein ParE